MTMTNITLIDNDGALYIPLAAIHDASLREYFSARDHKPVGAMLLARYPEGDCDKAPWPMRDPADHYILAAALYDARETGVLPPHASAVTLPDGHTFSIDGSNT
jgi:hypothetical protein